MFWKQFKRQPASTIDSLLSKEDCSLAELLDDDNVVQECKGDVVNRRLLDFLIREDNMEELVNLVTQEPSPELDEKLRFKHPNRACDVLSSEAGAIVDMLVRKHLDKLWSFMNHPSPLNPLLASFFTRVVNSLFRCKTQVLLDYLRNRDDAVQQLLDHIETSVIMDLLLGVIVSCDSFQMRMDLVQWLSDVQLVQRLVDLIKCGVPGDKQRNAGRVLSEMMRHCYTQLAQSSETLRSDLLLDMLEHDDVVQQLMKNMLSDATDTVPVLHGVEVLQTMLSLQLGLSQNGERLQANFPVVANEEAARHVVASLTPWLAELHKLLLQPPKSRPIKTSVGELPVPLGAMRLAVLQLLVLCVQTNVSEFNREVVRLSLPTTLLDLFFQFWWNSFLHQQIEQFVGLLLCGKSDDQEVLLRSLFINGRLLQRIGEAGLDNEADQAKPGGRRRGYMGHLINVSNSILHTMDSDDEFFVLLDGIANEDLSQWREWVQGPLTSANERINMVLGGKQPPMPLADSDDECRLGLSFGTDNIQQAYLQYQTQQLATEFVESFGFDDEDYTEPEESVTAPFDRVTSIAFELNADFDHPSMSLFEAAAQERIRPFGELPDEGPWLEQINSSAEALEERLNELSVDSDGEGRGRSPPVCNENSDGSISSDDGNSGPVVVFSESAVSDSPLKNIRESRAQGVSSPEMTADLQMDLDVGSSSWGVQFDDSDDDHSPGGAMHSSVPGWADEPEDAGWGSFSGFGGHRDSEESQATFNHVGMNNDGFLTSEGRTSKGDQSPLSEATETDSDC